jgi:hypothetical protein
MAHYHSTVGSRRSVPDTFSYLATFSNAAQWDPGVLDGKQLDPGPVHVGTRFRLVVPFLGRRVPLTYQVTAYTPDHEVILEAASGLLLATDRIVVTGAADGATVSYTADVRLRGPLGLLDPLLQRGFRGVGDRATAGLGRALAASRPPASSPVPPVLPEAGP